MFLNGPTWAQSIDIKKTSDQVQVSLLTASPGSELYTIFGHTALRVRDPINNIDRIYNYGTFDFDTNGFYRKFALGNLQYFLSVTPYETAKRAYLRAGRTISEQRLNLSPPQTQRLYNYLQTNARPENRYYSYEFFYDNCTTRVYDALDAYLNGVEPEENQIAASDPDLSKKVENRMLAVRSIIKDRVKAPQFKEKVASASLAIQEAQELLNKRDYSFWLNFFLAASILLREGLEAFLIIMVILSVLRSMEAGRTVKYVHGGWIVAIILGIAGWLLVQSLIGFSSLQREVMEGFGAFIAVAILLYVGFWMHNKTHASQWTHFIKEKVHGLLNRESMWGLALLSFIVVFREAFESIIFLSSISLKSAGSNAGIFMALIAVAVLIAGIGYVLTGLPRRSRYVRFSVTPR